MILILKPKGRGNWHRITVQISAPATLFPEFRGQSVAVGTVVSFGGLRLRVCEVHP